MAPLYSKLNNYEEAAASLRRVIDEEDQEILKVGLLTKIAGNYKKANKKTECIKASLDAYNLMKTFSHGSQATPDYQTCRCLVNLA